MLKLGVPVHIYTYERFLQGELNYLERIAKTVGLVHKNCTDTFSRDRKRKHNATKCATNYGIASNCDELQKFFDAQNYTTFAKMAGAKLAHLLIK